MVQKIVPSATQGTQQVNFAGQIQGKYPCVVTGKVKGIDVTLQSVHPAASAVHILGKP
jgi:hypothetical protein